MNNNSEFPQYTFIAWLISFVATLGSLFFSEVMDFPPCSLCWYQRIAMYPLVLLFAVGFFMGKRETFAFTLPIVFIGWGIALYHNLLHYEIVPENLAPCREGVSCSTVYIELLGFFTIPIMSFTAFSMIGALLYLNYRSMREE